MRVDSLREIREIKMFFGSRLWFSGRDGDFSLQDQVTNRSIMRRMID